MIKEIHALQRAGQWDAIGPLLAAQATAHVLRHSVVFRNLMPVEKVVSTSSSVFSDSLSRIEHNVGGCTVPDMRVSVCVSFPADEPLSEEKYASVMEALTNNISLLFVKLANKKLGPYKVLEERWLPQFFESSTVVGQIKISNVECVAPVPNMGRQRMLPQDQLDKWNLDRPHYEVHLSHTVAMSLDYLDISPRLRHIFEK